MDLTNEHLNNTRLRLLIDECTELCRKLICRQWNMYASIPCNHVAPISGSTLNVSDLVKLNPKLGYLRSGNVSEWDTSTVTNVLCTIDKKLPRDTKTFATTTSVNELRKIRNVLSHRPNTKVSDSEFREKREVILKISENLGSRTRLILMESERRANVSTSSAREATMHGQRPTTFTTPYSTMQHQNPQVWQQQQPWMMQQNFSFYMVQQMRQTLAMQQPIIIHSQYYL